MLRSIDTGIARDGCRNSMVEASCSQGSCFFRSPLVVDTKLASWDVSDPVAPGVRLISVTTILSQPRITVTVAPGRITKTPGEDWPERRCKARPAGKVLASSVSMIRPVRSAHDENRGDRRPEREVRGVADPDGIDRQTPSEVMVADRMPDRLLPVDARPVRRRWASFRVPTAMSVSGVLSSTDEFAGWPDWAIRPRLAGRGRPDRQPCTRQLRVRWQAAKARISATSSGDRSNSSAIDRGRLAVYPFGFQDVEEPDAPAHHAHFAIRTPVQAGRQELNERFG